MEKINNPELEVDTKVFVKHDRDDDWIKRHFKGWGHDGDMVCYFKGLTSFTGGVGATMKFWEVADGEFKGKTNLQTGVIK